MASRKKSATALATVSSPPRDKGSTVAFAVALMRMRTWGVFTRTDPSWDGCFVFLGGIGHMHTPEGFPVTTVMTTPCFFFYNGKGITMPGWLPSTAELLADDWVELHPAG
jgi:hypothetical protein